MNQSNPNAPPSVPQILPLSCLQSFPDHPYHVSDDDEMARLCESIRLHGVLSPILVRRDGNDYEIVSGHRRVFACRKLGMDTIPAVVQEMSRDEAVLKMVDSNLHREHLLPSEKAFAYKMKMDALKHQGKLRAYFPDQTPRQMRVSIMKILEEKKTARRLTPEPERTPVKKGGEAR